APVLRQIARYLPHHRSENASKTHPKSSHDKFKTASNCDREYIYCMTHAPICTGLCTYIPGTMQLYPIKAVFERALSHCYALQLLQLQLM
ncbi:hypothetical protein, partial [Bacteroides gallinaceum]|uniref:hypothetical protein n=1 Tax=Bacteroides gallinaceum TaxID=1462571 RepID=UPI001957769E